MKTLSIGLISLFSMNLLANSYLQNMSLENDYTRIFKANFTTEIKSFSTDGCSAFPDGIIPTQTSEWLDCCINHDIDYWIGGEKKLKKLADKNLGYCVSNSATPFLGISMDLGVRVGGLPSPLNLDWQWGYGWDYAIGFDSLIEQQLESVASKYDTVIDAVIKEQSRLSKAQMSNIARKLRSKLGELYPFLGEEQNEKLLEYNRIKKRIDLLEM